MCEPTTLTALAIAGTVASTGYAAYSQREAGKAAAAIGARNAAMSRVLARDARRRTPADEARIRIQEARLRGAQRAAAAGAGVVIDLGTPARITEETAAFAQLDIETLRNNAAREAWGYRTRASSFLDESAANLRQAGLASFGTILTGTGSALSLASPLIRRNAATNPGGG